MVQLIRKLTVFTNRLRKARQWLRLVLDAILRRQSSSLAATSMDICETPNLVEILGGTRPTFYSRIVPSAPKTLIGWGRKWSGRRAVAIAQAQAQDFLLVEDGFLRSVGRKDQASGMVFDRKGIYYDATQPSQLEDLIKQDLSASEVAEARSIATLWRQERVSKYNDMPRYAGTLPAEYVLVIDQVAQDLSIRYGLAEPSQFSTMLEAALAENPNATVVVKTHPDIAHDPTRGHFDLSSLAQNPQIQIIADACHPVHLIEHAKAVYTVTSQIGFEALIWGKPVHCFGVPFYAGYGLTDDRSSTPKRRQKASLDQVVHAALVRYPRYVHPETGLTCDVAALMRYVGRQRRQMQTAPDPIYAMGFSAWKRPILQQFLAGNAIRHVKTVRAVPDGARLAVWGNTYTPDVTKSHRIVRIEDGFLRSAGLGSDLIKPLSWIIDDLGIYFDPKQPSRLETILQAKDFEADMRARARALTQTLIACGVSKYNIGQTTWSLPPNDKSVILVPGQVENDASVVAGSQAIKTNFDLLQAVRQRNPDAYIIYKPHPDVVAGLRRRGASDRKMCRLCDQIVTHVDPIVMLPHIDAVHTMTSLLGFEALLRGIPVTCYGQPFYAGWGLTTDLMPIPRRTAKLTLEDLVAGALIAYPRYLGRRSDRLTTPEQAVADLLDWRATGPSRMPLPRRALRLCLRIWAASGLRKSA